MSNRAVRSHKLVVGLEIHVQLDTRSKMFTAVAAGQAEEPNALVDAQVLGLPGTLPVMNRRAVEMSVLMGLAMGCRINPDARWDRKSYFYPDLPKNYQISQYDHPLCVDGEMRIEDESGTEHSIRIRRAHLEEDAGKLLHEAPGGYPIDYSIVDLNRAGTPLLEIVTEPDFRSARQVAIFAQELQRLVQYLRVSGGQMQLGQMRFEPNINLHITDQDGTVHKTAISEVKNLNSFAALEQAVMYEEQRQLRAWEETGDLGKKATFGWDPDAQVTVMQRTKEQANDYRYFPDPDLPPVRVDEAWLSRIRVELPELPGARKLRYIRDLRLSEPDASVFAATRELGDLLDQVVGSGADPKRASSLLLNAGQQVARENGVPLFRLGLSGSALAEVCRMIDSGELAPSNSAKLLQALITQGFTDNSVRKVAMDLGLVQSTDTGPVDRAIEQLLAGNPPGLADYLAGKQAALASLMGQIMKSNRGLNPKVVQERLKARLEGQKNA